MNSWFGVRRKLCLAPRFLLVYRPLFLRLKIRTGFEVGAVQLGLVGEAAGYVVVLRIAPAGFVSEEDAKCGFWQSRDHFGPKLSLAVSIEHRLSSLSK